MAGNFPNETVVIYSEVLHSVFDCIRPLQLRASGISTEIPNGY